MPLKHKIKSVVRRFAYSGRQDRPQKVQKILYCPLRKTEQDIRLLLIEPGTYDSDIICSLRRVSLLDGPDYDTISYVWGDPNVREHISVNGHITSVPASSAAALRRMRKVDAQRVVWIDAICINQDDLDERAHQVTLMRIVYSKGRINLIYLGESKTAEQEVAEMYKIHDEARDDTRGFDNFRSTVIGGDGTFEVSQTRLRTDVDWKLLRQLLDNAWFGRVWVIQEAALAVDSLCTYGAVSFRLIDMLRVNLWLDHKVIFLPAIVLGSTSAEIGLTLWSLVGGDGDERGSIAQILGTTRSLKAFDPRDKVYGVLALMECTSFSSEINDQLRPDYSKPLEQVYRDATRAALTEEPGFWMDDIFQRIYHRSTHELDDLATPSWVPHWEREDSNEISRLPHFFTASHSIKQPSSMFRGAGDDLLLLKGLSLGAVNVLSKDWWTNTSRWRDQKALLIEVDALTRHYPSDVVAQTLLAGRDHRFEPIKPEDLIVWTDFREHLFEMEQSPKEVSELENGCTNLEYRISAFIDAVSAACENRRFFKTGDGKLGLGPKIMQHGDVLVIIYGCKTPYVLQPWGEHYKILGECYVDGVMYGEAVRKHKAEGRPDEEFILC